MVAVQMREPDVCSQTEGLTEPSTGLVCAPKGCNSSAPVGAWRSRTSLMVGAEAAPRASARPEERLRPPVVAKREGQRQRTERAVVDDVARVEAFGVARVAGGVRPA